MLTKEFTRLNNPHPHRIYYLGPRPPHTLALLKRLSSTRDSLPPHSPPHPLPLHRLIPTNPPRHDPSRPLYYRAF